MTTRSFAVEREALGAIPQGPDAIDTRSDDGGPSRAVTVDEIVERVVVTAPAQAGDARPGVTITYAQSLDGSITAASGARTAISGVESALVAHRLRASHDAIMVGSNTVAVDDPLLTVRGVEGSHPRPIIVDSLLRTPVEARVLTASGHRPILATTPDASVHREAELHAAGADVVRLPRDAHGRVDLEALLAWLVALGIRSLMVEGGARLLTSFLSRHLSDQALITIAPCFLGGVTALAGPCAPGGCYPRLVDRLHATAGPDLLIYGTFRWGG